MFISTFVSKIFTFNIYSVRLVGGANSLEGRVEVYWNNSWGTVCDDDWDVTDAHVVCRELGFTRALEAVSGGSRFGQGSGDILLNNVACLGNETRLVNCGHAEYGIQYCDHSDDAGVICINSSLVRLADGHVPYVGRVEVNIAGEWGTVCDHMWDLPDAQVVCRQLGYPSAIAAPCDAVYGEGSSSIIMADVRCSGQETQLVECSWGVLNQHHNTCHHNEDASAVCVNNIRLVNGSKAAEGRVEVFLNGQWGTICDDSFDINDAHVVCRQLGYWEATSFQGNARFGEGNWPILLDDLQCNGNETRISDCEHVGLGVHNCLHTEDVSVLCKLKGGVQLVNGTSVYDGRVEIFYNNEWGTVCNTSWGLNEARVVCQQISSPGAMRALGVSPYGAGSGTIVLNDVTCSGYEENLGECQHKGIGVNNCNHEQDAGVQCLLGVRLVGGASSLEGRVEVYWNNSWGTVCDDDWDVTDAHVVCRELGFTRALEAVSGGSRFGQGSGDILLNNVACLGNETRLVNCGHAEYGIQYCDHSEDAGVICINSSLVRLADGHVPYEGRVEVNIAGEWGTVCDHMWDLPDAQVVCRQLGYPSAIAAPCDAVYGEGSSSIIMADVRCSGQETQLVQCPWGVPNQHHHTCHHNEDASAVCVNNIRLVNGSKAAEGRVEVFLNGQWGTICGDSFDINDAHVVCRQLGYWEATSFQGNARFGEGNWPILLDDLQCNGNEMRISDCKHVGLGVHNCLHTEDVSVLCKLKEVMCKYIDAPKNGAKEGSLYIEGSTIYFYCDDGFTLNGQSKIRCNDGEWSDTVPSCVEEDNYWRVIKTIISGVLVVLVLVILLLCYCYCRRLCYCYCRRLCCCYCRRLRCCNCRRSGNYDLDSQRSTAVKNDYAYPNPTYQNNIHDNVCLTHATIKITK